MPEQRVHEQPAREGSDHVLGHVQWDVIVIGGGPAGLSAALTLGRAGRSVLVIDAGQPRNRFAAHVHGVLGNEGTPPNALLERGRAEAGAYGVAFRAGLVERVDETDHCVEVLARSIESTESAAAPAAAAPAPVPPVPLRARAVVVATGVSDVLPDVPGLAQRWGTGVLHCPYCHGWEVRGQRLGVLSPTRAGLHLAQLIRQWSEQVVVFSGGLGHLDALMQTRLGARGIELVNTPVVEVLGEGDTVTGVRTDDGRVTAVDALFVSGTHEPHDGFLAHLGLPRIDTRSGSVLAVDTAGRTSSHRIWAIGNVVHPTSTVPVAAGAGAITGAAINRTFVTEDIDAAVHIASLAAPDGSAYVDVARAAGPTSDTVVRRMRPEDVEETLDVFSAVAAEGRWLGTEADFDRTARRDSWLANLSDPSCVPLVVDQHDVIVGNGILQCLPYGVAGIGMALDARVRGHGLGGLLLDHLLAAALDLGAHKVELQVWPHNDRAIRLYLSRGFVVEGRLRAHYPRGNGELWDAIIMGLALDGAAPAGRSSLTDSPSLPPKLDMF